MSDPTQPASPARQKRGFALLSPERRAEIASLGGRQAHREGKAHKFTSQTAREAGRKGGSRPRRKDRA